MSDERALNEGVMFICEVMETDSDPFGCLLSETEKLHSGPYSVGWVHSGHHLMA